MTNIIQFNRSVVTTRQRITSASKPDFIPKSKSAEVILMMTPEDPRYTETKLTILAAHYWGKTA